MIGLSGSVLVLVWYAAWILSVLGYGGTLYLFLSGKKGTGSNPGTGIEDNARPAVVGMLGLPVIFIIGNLLNFFIPLNDVISFVILTGGMVLFFLNTKKNVFLTARSQWIVFVLLVVYTALFIFVKVWLYDTGLYHLQTVKWIKSAPVPLGLANLHHRFGYNSAWYILGAVMEPPRFIVRDAFFIINPLITFFYGTSIFLTIRKALQKKFSFSDGFLLLTFIPWLWHFGYQTASLSNNTPVFLLVCLIVYLVIYQLETGSQKVCLLIVLLSLFAVTVKLSAGGFAVGAILFALIRMSRKKKTVLILLSTAVVIILPWLVRGVMLSGAPLYPSKIGAIPGLKWSVSKTAIEKDAATIKRFARAGKDREGISGNWRWLTPWFKKNYFDLRAIAVPGVIGIMLLVAFAVLKVGEGGWRLLYIPLAISAGGIVFWFFTAPAVRFGYGYLHSASLLIFGFALQKASAWLRPVIGRVVEIDAGRLTIFLFAAAALFRSRANIYFFLMVTLCILIFIKRDKKFFETAIVFAFFVTLLVNPYLTGYFSEHLFVKERIPAVKIEERRTGDGIVIHRPVGTDQCWDSPLICTPYIDSGLKIEFTAAGTPRMFWFHER